MANSHQESIWYTTWIQNVKKIWLNFHPFQPLPTVGRWYLLQGPTEAAHKLLVLCHRPRRAEVHATGLRVQGAHALQTVGVAQVAWENGGNRREWLWSPLGTESLMKQNHHWYTWEYFRWVVVELYLDYSWVFPPPSNSVQQDAFAFGTASLYTCTCQWYPGRGSTSNNINYWYWYSHNLTLREGLGCNSLNELYTLHQVEPNKTSPIWSVGPL